MRQHRERIDQRVRSGHNTDPAGEEATLKRVYYDGSTITLVPANSAYRPKMYSGPALDDIQIEGFVTGYTHWF